MTLDSEIKKQFENRIDKEDLYNSIYSQLSDKERSAKVIKLIKSVFNDPGNRTILEIGAGQGGNVLMLRKCGFTDRNIFLNELLPERILAVKNNYPVIKMYKGDALKVQFNEQYDCVFQSTVFTSVLNDGDRKALADKMWGLLKPGGIILWYDFVYNNPKNKQVRKVSVDELKKLFPLAAAEKILKITLAPPIGRRIGKFYNLFNLPFLRSHILAVLKKD